MIELTYIPEDELARLRALDADRFAKAQILADASRLNTLYMIMNAGSGHVGSSFSAMDIVNWLFTNELDREGGNGKRPDVYFSSKGHDVPGFYGNMITLGHEKFEMIHALRRLNGLPGHPDVAHPLVEANTGSLGMGISKAKGMIKAAEIAGETQDCYILTGDGELQEGQFWESLVSAANMKLGNIVAIVDHNKIQSDTWLKFVSDLGDLEAKFAAFGWEVARIGGHDIKALAETLERFKSIPDKPKIIIADTLKGAGVSFMEPKSEPTNEFQMYHYHSGAPSPEDYARAVEELKGKLNEQLKAVGADTLKVTELEIPDRAPKVGDKLIAAYSDALLAQAEKHKNLIAMDGDLVLDTGLIPFMEKHPDRYMECGIAEMDMVSMAGGMALKGALPVVNSFACFLVPRANEHFFNNATEMTKVMYVGSLAGLIPAAPGHSHQMVRDISAICAVPHLVMAEPCCAAEVAPLFDYLVNGTQESGYLRLVSVPCEIPYEFPADYTPMEGQGVTLRKGTDLCFISYGPTLLPECYKAAEQLAEKGISAKVINFPWLNRVDNGWLAEAIKGIPQVVTVDNQFLHGGQGDMIARAMAETGAAADSAILRVGIEEIPLCGTPAEVLAAHKLDAASLVAKVEELQAD